MAALAEAVQRELEHGEVSSHGTWLIDLLNADLTHLKSRIDNGDYDSAEGTVTINASLLPTVDEPYKNVADAGILLAGVLGEREQCDIPDDRTVSDCINSAMSNLDTIFDAVGKPHTRQEQSETDNE